MRRTPERTGPGQWWDLSDASPRNLGEDFIEAQGFTRRRSLFFFLLPWGGFFFLWGGGRGVFFFGGGGGGGGVSFFGGGGVGGGGGQPEQERRGSSPTTRRTADTPCTTATRPGPSDSAEFRHLGKKASWADPLPYPLCRDTMRAATSWGIDLGQRQPLGNHSRHPVPAW